MPKALKFKDIPGFLMESHVELFTEAYIPGSRVLCREKNGTEPDVFFQIPTPVVIKMDEGKQEELKRQVRDWWLTRRTS
jgi:hypothetical protein